MKPFIVTLPEHKNHVFNLYELRVWNTDRFVRDRFGSIGWGHVDAGGARVTMLSSVGSPSRNDLKEHARWLTNSASTMITGDDGQSVEVWESTPAE